MPAKIIHLNLTQQKKKKKDDQPMPIGKVILWNQAKEF